MWDARHLLIIVSGQLLAFLLWLALSLPSWLLCFVVIVSAIGFAMCGYGHTHHLACMMADLDAIATLSVKLCDLSAYCVIVSWALRLMLVVSSICTFENSSIYQFPRS